MAEDATRARAARVRAARAGGTDAHAIRGVDQAGQMQVGVSTSVRGPRRYPWRWESAALASWQSAGLGSLMLFAAVGFSWALLAQHRAFNSNGWDLAWFDQIAWNSAHGRPFENSFAPWSFLGEHVEPILLLFGLVYRVRPDVEVLLLTQALVAVGGALPLYIGAKSLLGSATAALLLAAAFLVSPFLGNAMMFDFHPEVMGVTSIFATFACLVRGRPGWALVAVGSTFLLKEDAALVAIGLAWLFWRYGRPRTSIVLIASSVLYLIVVTTLVMPQARGGVDGGPQARWSYLGDSGTEIVAGAIMHPDRVVAHLAGQGPRDALASLATSQALLPLMSPAAIVTVPLSAAHLLSQHPEESELRLHYGVLPGALGFVAAAFGIVALTSRAQRVWASLGLEGGSRAVALAAVLLAANLVAAWFTGPFGARLVTSHYTEGPYAADVRAALRLIPADASVAAQSGILPHVSQRQRVWEFPPSFTADIVVVDRSAWRQTHGPPLPEYDYDAALAALPDKGYCLIFDRGPVEVWAKQGCGRSVPASVGAAPSSIDRIDP